MTFSMHLRQEAEELFQKIYEHPFVQGIKKGKLKPEQLIHYVIQDHQYLNTFMRIYAMAITRAEGRDEIAFFHDNIHFILHGETHPHRNFCRVAGVDYEQVDKSQPLAPSARNYMNHMWVAAQTGSLANLYAAILPCPWTYIYIAERMVQEANPSSAHPFYEWISFYTTEHMNNLNQALCKRLDEQVESLSKPEKERVKENFLISCYHEYCFWEMAYTQEQYPFYQEFMNHD